MAHLHLGDEINNARFHTGDLEDLLITLRDVGPLDAAARPLVLRWIEEHRSRVPYYLGLSEELLREEAAREGLRRSARDAAAQLTGPHPEVAPEALRGGRDRDQAARRLSAAASELAGFLDRWAEGAVPAKHQETTAT